jgi:penicillin amidase
MSGTPPEQGSPIPPAVGSMHGTARLRRWSRLTCLSLATIFCGMQRSVYRKLRQYLTPRTRAYRLPGLQAAVTVYRDVRGVPHIEGSTHGDIYQVQGYITAQDRLWQMDMMRRLVHGRLAEVIGSAGLASDRLFRTYALHSVAAASLPHYTLQTREWMKRYCSGVNAWIAQARKRGKLPFECLLLGYEPEPWTPVDMLCIGKLLAYNLSQNLGNELFYDALCKAVGEVLAQQLLPLYSRDEHITVSTGGRNAGSGERCSQEPTSLFLSEDFPAPDASRGSNGWVVSGKLTRSGKPLLANDPHIEIQTPSTWYQTHLIVTDQTCPMNVIGVAVPGTCGIILGHNEHIAWGVTNNRADVQDLFIEKRHPEDPSLFEFQGQWEKAQIQEEIIRVKGQADVHCTVLTTRHGPIISEVIPHDSPDEMPALALQWTALWPAADLEAILAMNVASNWEMFRETLRKYHTPVLNFLFASRDGTIAYRVGGAIPVRAKGEGLFPVPGWSGEYEWSTLIPFEDLPEVVNPEEGYIVSANNKVVDDDYTYFLTHSWDAPYRALRIAEILQRQSSLTLEEMSHMQGDNLNLQARRLLPAFLHVLENAPLLPVEQTCFSLLQAWTYYDEADQPAPLIYHCLWGEMSALLLAPRMGIALFQRMVDRVNITDELFLRAAAGDENDWVKEAGGLTTLVRTGFSCAVARCVHLAGPYPHLWTWGQFHHLMAEHPFGRRIPLLGRFLHPGGRHALGGSHVTVGMAGFHRETGRVTLGAPWRLVVDLANMSALDLNAPGQSGSHLSPWYDDQISLFVHNQPHMQLFKQEQYRNTTHTWILSPSEKEK